jgi:hypothetical protein
MLVDIFSRRYETTELRNSFEERDSRLLVQSFLILAEDIRPYYNDGKEVQSSVDFWTRLHNSLSRELGVKELSPLWFSYTTKWGGNDIVQTSKNSLFNVCENWMNQEISSSADQHIKERLSLIELGFRMRENEISALNKKPIAADEQLNKLARGLGMPDDFDGMLRKRRESDAATMRNAIEELNARFRQANYPLHYHNGFIQFSTDDLVQKIVESPFWLLVANERFKNVDLDMKEALDRRDSDGRDPAFYAARALESAIKIISDEKNWTTGKEKGAHNYIDNLASRSHGFISVWESTSLKEFFTHVRNPFGHGPGSAEMPALSREQTEWAIEFSMSWIKNLIRRL